MPELVRKGFFFYGSLMGQKLYGVDTVFRSPAFVDNAMLVTANGFAAMVLNRRGKMVKGEYVEIETTHKNYDRLIVAFDQWETNYDNDPIQSFYLRTTVKVRLQSNREVEALAYYINTNPESRWLKYIDWKEIPNGDWQTHIRTVRR